MPAARRGILRPLLSRPAFEVRRRTEHRAIEAVAEPFHRVRGTEEVPAVADLEDVYFAAIKGFAAVGQA